MAQLPDHLSHSQMMAWLKCGKAYQLQRLQRVPVAPTWWQVGGIALHDAIDVVNREFFVGHILPIAEVKATWEQAFATTVEDKRSKTDIPSSLWPCAGPKTSPQGHDWWLRSGLDQLYSYARWLYMSGWAIADIDGLPLSEFDTESTFGGVPVKGFLDAVYRLPDSTLLAVDYKSGKSTPPDIIQLSLYCRALEREHGMVVTRAAYFKTRDTELLTPQDTTRYTGWWFDRQFSSLRKAMEADVFLARISSDCFRCDTKAGCYAYGGADAWMWDPDHPQYSEEAWRRENVR